MQTRGGNPDGRQSARVDLGAFWTHGGGESPRRAPHAPPQERPALPSPHAPPQKKIPAHEKIRRPASPPPGEIPHPIKDMRISQRRAMVSGAKKGILGARDARDSSRKTPRSCSSFSFASRGESAATMIGR